MMRMNTSKGLDYPDVYMLGLDEDLMPHRNSIEADTVEEERRLMYVGITRAKRTLTLTYAGKRRQFGEVSNTTHSRFLGELPPEDMEWEGKTEVTPEPKHQHAMDAIDALDKMLEDF